MINKHYDKIVFVTRILIEALAALYISVAIIWKLPYGEQVGLTATAITAFLNSLLKVRSDEYFEDHEIVPKGDDEF